MKTYKRFLRDEAGAITIDWVALTAGILLLGIAVVYAIFNNGVEPLLTNINTQLQNAGTEVTIGDAPDLSNAGALDTNSGGGGVDTGADTGTDTSADGGDGTEDGGGGT